jgi:D-threo-aldose 1-dehydrogenase
LPGGYVLATKVDPLPGGSDFSGARVYKSVEESLERLGADQLQVCYLHDPEKISFEEGVADDGPLQAMVEMQKQGPIKYIGVAGGPIDLMLKYVDTGVMDAVISHNSFTLVDQSAEPLIAECAGLAGSFSSMPAPYGGGIPVKGPDALPKYCYHPIDEDVLDRVRRIEAICKKHGVELAAAALQFSLRIPALHQRLWACRSQAVSSRHSISPESRFPRRLGLSWSRLSRETRFSTSIEPSALRRGA